MAFNEEHQIHAKAKGVMNVEEIYHKLVLQPLRLRRSTCRIFGNKIKKVYDQRSVDFEVFAQRLEDTYNSFDEKGYDVVNVVPVVMGTSDQCSTTKGDYIGDVGFSITRGALVVGKRRED
ncbi:hypothetical protein [Pseudomonas trivialis]|uniref:hypothetical protein n=1 Tax=Pseudomonas trivialis TaxID=200450 RepID=UPI001910A634|nr:hypothetical protein [Pseudomonas trivialis]